MAQINNYKESTITSIKETLIALDFCFGYDKSNNEKWETTDAGILGMPALILLSSIIDTMGAYFRGTNMEFEVDGEKRIIEKAAHHFYILNHTVLFKLGLSDMVITDFYSKYRSVATHNGTLPPFNYMDIGNVDDDIFVLNSTCSIEKLVLKPLYIAVKNAVVTFNYYLQSGNWSSDHKLAKELESKSGTNSAHQRSPTITGSTESIVINPINPDNGHNL
ncbi:hypothetical protein HH214_18440 [Mucilaginibacter robiniae]|uniref:Uncharacterized protein n=1 Tax=Mucilaginibacter robiniae TaxID=2728022 RepID=A0A7L5E3V5_9SPHI|nr:hypothetical protein [Mucilaginibacter robiniae]QJD97711.1 hypothetical protein HH214_18440 [Mucilaginibacter robiniae]